MLRQPVQSGDYGKGTTDLQVDIQISAGNPFPGLRPFSLDESHLFFGREGQADEILVKLAQNRFVTVLGYSGSGKSSLMYCGLVPVLYGGFMTQTGPDWSVVITRPGTSPISNLAESIVEYMVQTNRVQAVDKDIHKAIISSVLRSSPFGLVEVGKYLQRTQGENIFFLVDQFEELFRYRDNYGAPAHDESSLYVNLFLTAIDQVDVPIFSALTMRSDFIGNCSVFPALTGLINHSNYLVPQMTRDQKKMVIEGPISVAGGRISQRLVKKLLSDVGSDQDQLPILQHALMRTWDYWLENREPNEPIDIRHYNAVGRIHEALSQHANEAYDELNTRQREIAELLFKSITEKNQENKGMRRPARLGLIMELAEAEEDDVIYVVDHFRKVGRSFLMPGANVKLNSESMIELSHESLMRIWKRLDVWVEEEFESAQMYKRLSEAAAMYQIGKTGLWRPPDLQLALNWQKKQRPTREWAQRYDDTFERAVVFLDTSRITYEAELKNQEMMQRRVLRRTRATAVVLGGAFIVAIVFFVLAYLQKIDADGQRLLAEEQRLFAVEQTKLAKQSQMEALQQSQLATRKSKELETANARLQDALKDAQSARFRAQEALIFAQREQEKAILAGEGEKNSRIVAEKQTEIAKREYDRANQLLYLAIAQSLATKSIQIDDDKQVAGLLAMQGYHYHTRNDGPTYDPFIYEGLYTALTKLNNLTYNAIRAPGAPHVHIKSLAMSAKSDNFYTSGVDGKILIGNHQQLTVSPTKFNTPYPSKVIAVSIDEEYLVNGSDSSYLQVYSLKNPSSKPDLIKGFRGASNALDFLPDNSGVLLASSDKSVYVADIKSGTLRKLVTLPFEVKTMDIHPSGKRLAAGSWTGQLMMIDLTNYSYTVMSDDPSLRILSVKFNKTGELLGVGIDDKNNKRGIVKVMNLNTSETLQFSGHRAGVTDVEFSPDGKLLASAGSDKRLLLWILDKPGELPIVMNNNNGFVWDIAFTPTSQYLVAACSESEIRVWATDPALLAKQICPKLTRNLTPDEWSKYVGQKEETPYENTCVNLLIEQR